MIYYYYLMILVIIVLVLNNFLKKNFFLTSNTGDNHQLFTSNSQVPLSGGLVLYLGFLYTYVEQISIIVPLSLLLSIGIFSDLKILTSAKLRLFLQIFIVLLFTTLNDLKIADTRLELLDLFLNYDVFNYSFVIFCILIVINGTNFLDGLNTLNLGYYLLVTGSLWFLEHNNLIIIDTFNVSYIFYLLLCVYFLNFFNLLYLGDSGSYILGFMYSFFLINVYNQNFTILSPFFIILLLWYPCFENLFSMIRKNKLNISTLKPDTNHFHQLVFFYFKKKLQFNILLTNVFSANLINIFNIFNFIIALKYIYHTKILIGLILLNLISYIIIYLSLFSFKIKKV